MWGSVWGMSLSITILRALTIKTIQYPKHPSGWLICVGKALGSYSVLGTHLLLHLRALAPQLGAQCSA